MMQKTEQGFQLYEDFSVFDDNKQSYSFETEKSIEPMDFQYKSLSAILLKSLKNSFISAPSSENLPVCLQISPVESYENRMPLHADCSIVLKNNSYNSLMFVQISPVTMQCPKILLDDITWT